MAKNTRPRAYLDRKAWIAENERLTGRPAGVVPAAVARADGQNAPETADPPLRGQLTRRSPTPTPADTAQGAPSAAPTGPTSAPDAPPGNPPFRVDVAVSGPRASSTNFSKPAADPAAVPVYTRPSGSIRKAKRTRFTAAEWRLQEKNKGKLGGSGNAWVEESRAAKVAAREAQIDKAVVQMLPAHRRDEGPLRDLVGNVVRMQAIFNQQADIVERGKGGTTTAAKTLGTVGAQLHSAVLELSGILDSTGGKCKVCSPGRTDQSTLDWLYSQVPPEVAAIIDATPARPPESLFSDAERPDPARFPMPPEYSAAENPAARRTVDVPTVSSGNSGAPNICTDCLCDADEAPTKPPCEANGAHRASRLVLPRTPPPDPEKGWT